jgi:hypothetical protein
MYMKQPSVAIFVMLAIFGFLIWNRKYASENFTDVTANVPVAPATIQTIVNAIQARVPDLYPVQTVYVNPLAGDQGSMIYNSRILFLNTRGFFGVQYDVQSDSDGNIITITGQVQPDAAGPFQGYNSAEAKDDKYQDFDTVEATLEKQFADLRSKAPDATQKLDTWLDIQRAQQRGVAMADAQSNSMPAGSTDRYLENAMVA